MSRRVLLIAVEIVTPLRSSLAVLWVWTANAESYYYPPLGDVVTAFAETWVFERFGEDITAEPRPARRRLRASRSCWASRSACCSAGARRCAACSRR